MPANAPTIVANTMGFRRDPGPGRRGIPALCLTWRNAQMSLGAGLVYRERELVEAVAEKAGAAAYRIRVEGGTVTETALEVRRLR